MYDLLIAHLREWALPNAEFLAGTALVLLIAVLATLIGVIAHQVLVKLTVKLAGQTRTQWDDMLVKRGVFKGLAQLAPGVAVYLLADAWLPPLPLVNGIVHVVASLWLLVASLLTLIAVVDAGHDIYNSYDFARQMPIQGPLQVIKLLLILVAIILAIAILIGKSPLLLFSGLGAMTAVLMLVFKDPLLGFVAGIQLSSNRMLAIGDWLEMPKYGADGDVIEIGMTTVKVQNWDKTITTIPTYALISDSFKNWRGMSDSGGRRIKRAVFVDMTSIRFLSEDDLERLRRAELLSEYITAKREEIAAHNLANKIDPASPINGRKLTNIGTFRAYLVQYLRQHAQITQEMTLIVRQLQPTPEGLPLELYCFSSDTRWAEYENIQSDIFDHVLAALAEFDLRVYQSPTGADLRALAGLKG